MAVRKRSRKQPQGTTFRLEKIADPVLRERVREILSRPVGTPLPQLSREEAIAIVDAGIGGRPDLPPGKEYVRKMGWLWRGLVPGERNRS